MFGGLHGLRHVEEIQRGLGLNMTEKTPQEQGRDFLSILEAMLAVKDEDRNKDMMAALREEIGRIRGMTLEEVRATGDTGTDSRKIHHRMIFNYLGAISDLMRFVPMFHFDMIMCQRASKIMEQALTYAVFAGSSNDKEAIESQFKLLSDNIARWQTKWKQDWEHPRDIAEYMADY